MSARNKFQNKKLRVAEKLAGKELWPTFNRRDVSAFPHSAAVNVLANCKAKSTSARRKRIQRALQSIIEVPRQTPRDSAVKLTIKLQHMAFGPLVRVIQKSARRAATFKYILDKLDEGSTFRAPLVASQTVNLSVLRQAQAEYNFRTKSSL